MLRGNAGWIGGHKRIFFGFSEAGVNFCAFCAKNISGIAFEGVCLTLQVDEEKTDLVLVGKHLHAPKMR